MVVEEVERLRELECVLGNEGRFLRRHGGLDLSSERSCQQHHLPEGIAIGSAKQFARRILIYSFEGRLVKAGLLFAQLPKNVARANHGILAVWAGFALKAEGILEIERDDRSARKFQKEVAQRSDGDGVRDGGALASAGKSA
jgi:hypothetical protein